MFCRVHAKTQYTHPSRGAHQDVRVLHGVGGHEADGGGDAVVTVLLDQLVDLVGRRAQAQRRHHDPEEARLRIIREFS